MATSHRAQSATPRSAAHVSSSTVIPSHSRRPSGAGVLLAIALGLLTTWLLGVLSGASALVHVLLLVGLMLLMIAVLMARDAAMRSAVRSEPDKR
jgi:hypothetical protein